MLLRLMLRRSLCEVFLGLGVGLLSLLYIAIIAYNILCFDTVVNGVFEDVLPKMVVLQKIKLQKI
jgi:hypothetical protein